MRTSRPIEVQGRFLGVAVTRADTWRFIATHPAVAALHGASFASPAEARRSAHAALLLARPTHAAGVAA